uniref:Twin-arginine translocation pathway signal n=1 Tax=Rhodopseudomonas palustris (strain BisA53) TaxID=316055 RepID=Q07P87_RHOP5
MIDRPHSRLFSLRIAALGVVLAAALGGCAGIGDSAVAVAFADPAKYDLYDCQQLETERKSLAKQIADVDRLIAKAETGAGGAVVAEVAYRNSHLTLKASARLADDAWVRNKCDRPVQPALPPVGARAPLRSGGAVY